MEGVSNGTKGIDKRRKKNVMNDLMKIENCVKNEAVFSLRDVRKTIVLIRLVARSAFQLGSDFHAIFTHSGSIFRHFSMVPSTYIFIG